MIFAENTHTFIVDVKLRIYYIYRLLLKKEEIGTNNKCHVYTVENCYIIYVQGNMNNNKILRLPVNSV